jgi:hypothetical protein
LISNFLDQLRLRHQLSHGTSFPKRRALGELLGRNRRPSYITVYFFALAFFAFFALAFLY